MKVLDKLVDDMNELSDKSDNEYTCKAYNNVCYLTEEYENIILDCLTQSALNLLENVGICKDIKIESNFAQQVRTQLKYLIEYPELSSKDYHDMWLVDMKEQGYTYGSVYSKKYRTHPNIVDYFELPKAIFQKDTILDSLAKGFK